MPSGYVPGGSHQTLADIMNYIFETEPFPHESLDGVGLTNENIQCLRITGLPSFAAPHLYFGEFDGVYLPSIEEWTWLEDWGNADILRNNSTIGTYRVLGSSQDNAPIFLKPNDSRVYTFEEGRREEVVMSSCIKSLLDILNAYAVMIDKALEETTANVVESKVVKASVMNEFKNCWSVYKNEQTEDSDFWDLEIKQWKIIG